MHVLGIDAGGTKTVCLLADDQGMVVSEARGGGANLHVAGEDREDEMRTVRAIMRRIGHKSRVLVVNDALIALVAGAKDAPGIVINAGTGSIVYGRNGSGEAA